MDGFPNTLERSKGCYRQLLMVALAFHLACSGQASQPDPGSLEESELEARPRYVIGVDREFPPYSFVDDDGHYVGYSVDLSRAIAELMGFEIELRAGTHDELVAALEDGEIDIIPHLAASQALETRFQFTLPHIETNDAIFVREDATGVFTEAHLQDRPILVWQPAAVEELVDHELSGSEILSEQTVAETLRRLAAGEGDCALVPHLTALQLVRDLKLTNLRIAGPPIQSYTRSLSFAVRRGDGDLLKRLDDGLTLVTTTQRYPELYNTWFGIQDDSIPTQVLISWLLWISLPLLAMVLLATAWSWSLRNTVARRTAKLRESEERLQGILDNAPMMITMKDSEGRYLLVNQKFEAMVGQQRHRVQDATDSKFFPPEQVAELRANDARVLETGAVDRCEEVFPTGVGPRTFDSVRFPLHDAEDGIYAVCAISADVTDQKRAEEEKQKLEAQIQQAQKLESLGVLAGGIAHDFNNLLMGILGNTGLALLELDPDSSIRARLRDVESTSRRAADLCRQMLAYSGKGKFVVQPVDISQLVVDMTQLLEVSVSKKAVLERDFGSGLPTFEADATQIRQVVMNLITNASEALDDQSGTITVRTGVMDCDAEYLAQTYLAEPSAVPGRYVFREVRDTGTGMDEATRERIFDPFFSTKFAGRGLGLAATLGIVRGHRGALEVESTPGEGTVFRVLLPASEKPLLAQINETATPDAPLADGTILVVDDEEMVQTIARRVLERAGYKVLTAGDGEEGYEVFRRHAQEISLVLLDVTMPRMDGDEAYRRMRSFRSDLRVLLTSGYNEHEATQQLAGRGLAGFIQKPYAPAALLRKVREALEQCPAERTQTGNEDLIEIREEPRV
ncbi:MAG: transporter substrate-binding domain-containing protein [Acidobacteriota bacterium]